MSYSEILREQLFEGFDKADSAFDKADSAVKFCIGALPFWVPGWVKDEARDRWSDCHEKGLSAMVEWRENAEDAGRAYDLTEAAEQWRTAVTAILSQQPGVVSAGQLMADDAFDGQAAEAYRQAVIPSQREAMEAIVEHLTAPLSGLLDDMADAVDDYNWNQLHAVLAVFAALIALAFAAASSETGIGLVAGLVAAALALGDAIFQSVSGEHNLDSATASASGDIEGMLSNGLGLEGGHWPKAAFPA